MKRFLYSIALIVTILLLASCSIPIGDDVLNISTDGVKFIKGDSDETKTADEAIDEEDMEDEADEPEEADGNDEDETEGKQPTDQGQKTADSANITCPEDINTNYDEIIKVLEDDFYFPECADVKSIRHGGDRFRFDLYQEGGNYEELFNEYLEFTGEQVTNRNVNYSWETADLRFYLDPDTETGDISIGFTQRDEGVNMEFDYILPDLEDEDDDD